MELWRKVWRVLARMLSTEGLTALAGSLLSDDERLLQKGGPHGA